MVYDVSRGALNFAPETAWGVVPGSGKERLRITGESLAQVTDFIASREIQGSRQTADQIRTDARVEGSTEHEISYGSFDTLFSHFAMNNWDADGGGAGIDRLEMPGLIFKSGFFERDWGSQAGGSAAQYNRFNGCVGRTLRWTVRANDISTLEFGWFGKVQVNTASEGAGTPAAATSTQIMNGIDHVTATEEGGAPVNFFYTELEINMDNNLRPQPAVGNFGPIGIGLGTISVTGRMRAYYDDIARVVQDKYLSWTPSSTKLSVADDAGNAYDLVIPKLRWSAGPNPLTAINEDGFVNLEFAAYLDAGVGSPGGSGVTAYIDRNPA